MNSTNKNGQRPKTWHALLTDMLNKVESPKQHIIKLLKENDYLTSCEIIKDKMGREQFVRTLRQEYLTPSYLPADIHKNIFRLDSRLVITPNFDKIYDSYATGQTHGSVIIKNHYDSDIHSAIRENGRLIIKAHGTIDTPEKLIFTRKEYAEARSKYSNFYEILEALSVTHTFIFIGCGVNDPDIRLLLEDTFFKHDSYKPHYMLMPNGSLHKDQINIIQRTMNLRVLGYSKNNNHIELTDSLANLEVKVNSVRDELRQNSNW
ncbi:SIR2 family protein (plasmid) [Photobacterium sp. GJ3]|uniref:SIR2 family NAD-dependent protein deacylase n=1 Tax=Photobacterium sp. GJ3 TaxID=2829502 RepID=UPI001B8BC327|nr:SIR2 family protein [Photobacterium sp. GJ3]QUJ69359.1 SIR2 family protein [Photobacterium sp. GJ3]